jgi:hypothetical protein
VVQLSAEEEGAHAAFVARLPQALWLELAPSLPLTGSAGA